ncbi:MAG: rRNA maturation RNase YbeY [Candidatus Coproplasma sp.]
MNNLNIYCDQLDFSSLAAAFEGEFVSDCHLALEIVFVGKDEIRELNAERRSVDAVTDVLSFPTLDGIFGKEISAKDFPYDIDEQDNLFIGSIVICTEVAREQAEEYGHSYERELFYLATHGVCHLLGYDHMTEDDKKIMREKEERVLKKLNLTRDEQ